MNFHWIFMRMEEFTFFTVHTDSLNNIVLGVNIYVYFGRFDEHLATIDLSINVLKKE